ncbi:Butyrophilin subfamily 2 member A2 [Platysternon megacephalum]|uniref:Butyrophilin subfamily 2 member A2 n=1 Tax=Platysternon megacephalum TaxID=55544 RepID=A0A4D9DRC0_9SAUR|nr:Butyrophilin subfamily 2 member A2 [Platysternon megacephalum]
MAGSDLVQELQLEVTCSICTKYMEVPVMLDCGHNYCEDCISQHWDRVEEEEEPRQCPLCFRSFRQRSFRQNKSLANVVEIVQWFPSQDVRSTSSSTMGKDPQGRQHLLHFLQDGQQMILQKLQEMEERNGTREEGEERKEEPDPEQQDENITLSRSGSEKPSKPRSQSPEPCACRLPLLNSVQKIQMMGYRASPELFLSSDRRSVRLGDERKDLPNYHKRFDTAPCVLANEGFSFGRYYWEVEVWDAGCWAVGVARKSVKRKGHLRLTPEHDFWTVEMHMGKYWALNTSLALVYCNERLHRVGVYLDYTEGQVAFYNAESLAHLYTFTASFTEEIFPFFYTKDKTTPLVINRSEIEGWIPLTEQTQPSPAPII